MKLKNIFKFMSKSTIKVGIVIAVSIFGVYIAGDTIYHYHKQKHKHSYHTNDISEEGLLLNDNLEAIRNADNTYTIKNTVTGEITSENIQFDWTHRSPNDSLGVFCANGKRGYYNSYTGKVVIPAEYRRAWIFSEGLAAVQKNGKIGFINKEGKVVIPFRYPYHGNTLSEFIFKNGYCAVADSLGKCGIINCKGEWVIKPEYDNIKTFNDFAIVRKEGVRLQIDYAGQVINAFVLDNIRQLTYYIREEYVDNNGDKDFINREISTNLYVYHVGGRCGLMNDNCQRLTKPIYSYIEALNSNIIKATLPDDYSIVILNNKGELIK